MTSVAGWLPRLFLLEARRSVAAWLLLPMIGMGWLLDRGGGSAGFLLWVETSVTVRNTVLFAGPFIGGVAAWMAGRDRRRGMEDLLATTPRPPWARRLVGWAGTAVWALLAYLAVGAYLIALTARQAAWGGPVLWPMLVGLLALPAHAALGCALGSWLPSRFTAPLVAIASFFGQGLVGAGIVESTRPAASPVDSPLAWISFLSPTARLDTSVWYGVRPHVGPGQALFLLGLTGLALGAVALRDRAGAAPRVVLAIGGALAVAGVVLVIRDTPRGGTTALTVERHMKPYQAPEGVIPHVPVCGGDALPVCVHPAYQPWLGANSAVINRVAAPLLGLPGAPVSAEQAVASRYGTFGDLLLFTPIRRPEDDHSFARAIATILVSAEQGGDASRPGVQPRSACPGGEQIRCAEAQNASALWLLRQAGFGVAPAAFDPVLVRPSDRPEPGAVVAAAERFAALTPEERRAWLRAHYADLRTGKVRLEDLP